MGGKESSDSSSSSPSPSLWLAPDPSKRWGEIFFLCYTPFWLTLCLGIVIPCKLYESFTELEYLLLGLISAVPSFLIPMMFVGKADSKLCWKDCYWVKAMYTQITLSELVEWHSSVNLHLSFALQHLWKSVDGCELGLYPYVHASLWIIIFSYVGNYFWTHYFFTVLGASYTFPSWKMNNVPHTTFLLTHVCFLFYHVTSNITIRRLRHAVADLPDYLRWAAEGAWILALSYFIAYLETLAVSNFPYYEFVDRASMYTVGSLFYAIYFFVSFPMFLRIDEKPGDLWELPRVAVDSLGAAMLVTIILDLWRIFLGPIVPLPETKQCLQQGLPWFPGHATQA
ncbi:hypothetical protein POTOM_050661 [Populus tomentosa]|uniref:Cycloeucalenol cycloisomerase n=1 Tax=Populus tomentosa TaxID=118781 RepID=A0A8X7YC70_POPTO|nr:hypothetical protein POTOM_050661 [Populus tomentosa]